MLSTCLRTALGSVAAAALLLPQPSHAQPKPQPASPAAAQPAQSFAPATRIPFDPAVTTGTLPNGLRYYIRKNGEPDKRVMLQLAVKAGSIDEEDDQQGLAHLLEHMAFNGTKRFKPGELIATLESTGARMGPHLNAYTSFDETVYMFQLQTDRAGLVEKGLQALADFAGGMALDPKEIDKERGVVIEEWRGRLGAGQRLLEQQVPVLFHKSRYAERLPIGKPEVLKNAPPERVRAFYRKWYRPDRMALVVVGDIDPADILPLVRREFGALVKPSTPPPPRNYPVPLHKEMLVKVATDPEAQGSSSVSLMRKRARTSSTTVGDYQESLVHQLVYQIFNERFRELARKPDAPFLGAGASGGGLAPSVETFTLSASVQHGQIEAGLAALQIEANRVTQHGFGPAELDRAKRTLLASYERAYNERGKTDSDSYAGEYVRHFLEEEPSPGIAYEFALAKAFVPSVTVDIVTAAARRLLTEGSPAVTAVSPQKSDITIPTDEQLRAALAKADAVAVTAWADASSGKAIVEKVPDPGAVTDRREITELGVTVVRYANGVEAWFKPTDFKNDQVLFSLVSPGGLSLASPALYPEASLSPAYVNLSGAGGHTSTDLQKLLAGKIASAVPTLSHSSHGFSGTSSPADLETALQLLYVRFTAPGDDPQAFDLMKTQLRTFYGNRDRSPTSLWSDKVGEINTGNHYTAQPLTLDRIEKLDRAAMSAFYRQRYANAADFTFFLVGTFKLDAAIPLVGRYVGSLPSKGKASAQWKDMGMKFPAKTERATVTKGSDPKALTILSFAAEPPLEENEQARVVAATEVLEIAVRDILREELGETYTVGVGLSQPLPQRGAGRISVNFGGAPDKIDKMVERTLQEVKRLQQDGPSEDLTNRAKEAARREHEVDVRTNGFWLGRLQSAKLLHRDPLLILSRMQRIDAITPALLHEVFKKYFPLDRYTVVTLVPEK